MRGRDPPPLPLPSLASCHPLSFPTERRLRKVMYVCTVITLPDMEMISPPPNTTASSPANSVRSLHIYKAGGRVPVTGSKEICRPILPRFEDVELMLH